MSSISPGLVLVDPDLGAAARAQLYEPGRFRPGWEPRAPLATPTREKITSPTHVPSRTARNRRVYTRAFVLAAGAATAAAVTVGLVAGFRDHGVTRMAAVEAATQSRLEARAAKQTRAARSYTWPVVPGADFYEIEIVRDGRNVYGATTRATTLRLPAELALPAGRYTLSATPRSNGSSREPAARPVVEATFQVTS